MEPDTEVAYKVDAYYAPNRDLGVRFDDPDLAIAWPIPSDRLVLSDKDPATCPGSATCRRCSPTPEL